ncbi:MAG TPA: beta-ketoacyl synthase N-terminal-like domain-containing protein [Bryobacteraceae bacterium]
MERDEIAIVGIGCRFPGADSPSGFWRLLSLGESAIGPMPQSRGERQSTDRFAGGYLAEVAGFDPAYFGIPGDQAPFIDPQQRLMLDVAAGAIEDAGISPRQLTGPHTGVFVGISTHDYAVLFWNQARPHAAATSGTSNSAAANRISHWLGASGPSLAIDTACSSSLTALHYACQSIRSGDIDFAIVGGVSVLLIPPVTEAFAGAGFISAGGCCRPLDRNADGYVRSEGAAAVLLKRVARADRAYAVVRGTAVNHNGFSNGITAPNPAAQADVIRSACRNAGIQPAELQYIETMGSATVLGDAIELRGIARAIGADTNPGHACILGSVKGNVGHMEAASGMAAVIKTALCLWHCRIPPTPNLSGPSQAFWPGALQSLPVAEIPWPDVSGPRLAGVNSFGFGGANAHVVLANAPQSGDDTGDEGPATHVLLISAKTEAAFHELADTYVTFLNGTNEATADICYTASAGRPHHRFRIAVGGKDNGELAAALAKRPQPASAPERFPGLGFVLSNSSPIPDPAQIAELKRIYPEFDAGLAVGEDAGLALQYGMAMLLMEWGLRPAMLICETEAQQGALSAAARIPIVLSSDRPAALPVLEMAPNGDAWPASLWTSLYMAGAPLEWERLYAATSARKVTIPGHPRNNRPFWFEAPSGASERSFDGNPAVLEEIERELDSLGY